VPKHELARGRACSTRKLRKTTTAGKTTQRGRRIVRSIGVISCGPDLAPRVERAHRLERALMKRVGAAMVNAGTRTEVTV